jgi:hypothetical protein
MKRYKVVARATGFNSVEEQELEDFTEKDFIDFENETISNEKQNDLLTTACELIHFEWWVEEIKE